MRRPLIAALLLAACGPTAPAPVQVGKSAPAEAAKAPPPSPAPAPAATPAAAPAAREKLEIPKEPPLTAEEIALIESDPKTLTPDQRRARAHALRRKILQNPDSPQAQELERLRRDVEAGLVKPELPANSGGKDLVLSAPEGKVKSAPAPAPAPAP
ncbi:hypothetical protein [Nannocystis sp. SCPEA4]|uniref:hypothetical protein n=1 Tax=Nannocystis sp. SCPEA4 TaxID=2996787 RepID=UPI00226F3FE3|nr:hypothetical protein [Nannocystis sp. SCPEA4]MCY1058151.1 hypothetical protein [Nannocystis sp. SCPEA4]